MVSGFAKMTATMTNDPKDRHVLATEAKCQAQFIVTSNLKDSRPSLWPTGALKQFTPTNFLSACTNWIR